MKKLPKRIITQRISEFRTMQRRRGAAGGPIAQQSAADTVMETALFLEDVFGIEIDDSEMSAELLGSGAELSAFVVRKMGAG